MNAECKMQNAHENASTLKLQYKIIQVTGTGTQQKQNHHPLLLLLLLLTPPSPSQSPCYCIHVRTMWIFGGHSSARWINQSLYPGTRQLQCCKKIIWMPVALIIIIIRTCDTYFRCGRALMRLPLIFNLKRGPSKSQNNNRTFISWMVNAVKFTFTTVPLAGGTYSS